MEKNTHCNKQDHDKWSRKTFLQSLGLAGVGGMALANTSLGFSSNSQLANALRAVNNDRILIIIRLFGGNDGLNTVIPLNQYDIYAKERPTLRVPQNQLWKLNSNYAMPNHMSQLQSLWRGGRMKVVNSTGYDEAAFSHFRGNDFLVTADPNFKDQNTGIMGRYFEALYPDYLVSPPDIPTAIEVGFGKNLAFHGDQGKYSLYAASPDLLETVAKSGVRYDMSRMPRCSYGDMVKFMRGLTNSTYKYSSVVSKAYNASSDYVSGVGYDNSDMGKSLRIISRLIKGNLGTKVYMITVNGFDTHTVQAGAHKNLMSNLANSISHFYKDLDRQGKGDKVLTMCMSEMGRRLTENASKGTDHGTAGPIMLFGSGLNGNGLVGKHASLKKEDLLDGGNHMAWHTDFRSVYSNILKEWMQIDANTVDTIMLKKKFPDIDLGLSSSRSRSFNSSSASAKIGQTVTEPTPTIASTVDAQVIYGSEEGTYISFNNPTSQNVTVSIYDLSGKQVGVMYSNFMLSGEQRIPLNMSQFGGDSVIGYYIFRIKADTFSISKKFVSK